MPARSVLIRDRAGNVIGRACYREPVHRCATSGCAGAGVILCDYPVKRRGRTTSCNRRVCKACAARVGEDQDFCPPHARMAATPDGAQQLVTVCAACLSSSCAHREEGYTCAGREEAGTRVLTVADWKQQLAFGVAR